MNDTPNPQGSNAPGDRTDAEKARLFDQLIRQMNGDKVVVLWDARTSLEPDELISHLETAGASQ